ncbi:MAG: hypothetical protein QOI15_696 [Pseudonocardiales bacterium]|jgi:uncharacterized membrane-anchored protein YjiN (DUF445 family)|nr:hypothetical protein [Pseudonocardiales bacterium]MDT4919794.1 hypothetical protein [Pseudonocardiales bacterium]MDT4941294.1 hypothetical protein [Pseudonocardiales bacterium]
MSVPVGTTNTFPALAAERLRALRRMKAFAGGLLLLAAIVYVLCRALTDGDGGWGYVEAAAEASMVGGLADWFAVTALFRHPLRLPIPHTAIIPAKKDQIGAGLAGFVQEYFLTSEIVSERVAAAQVPRRLGEWLAEPAHAHRLAEEVSSAVGGLAGVLNDDDVRSSVAAFADRRLRQLDIAALLARLLDAICDAGQHQAALTTFLRGARKYLEANRGEFRDWLGQESPEWVPEWLDERVFNKGFSLLQDFVEQVVEDDDHGLRRGFDTQLRELAERLRSDPEQIAKVEAARDQLLEHPRIAEYLGNLWDSLKQFLLREADDAGSDLRRSAETLTIRLGQVLRDDPEIAGRVDAGLQRLTQHVVTHYAEDLTAVISTTVERWDTEETSNRLELQVGRDLQFIRINGTVVGALAGLAIYALSQLF